VGVHRVATAGPRLHPQPPPSRRHWRPPPRARSPRPVLVNPLRQQVEEAASQSHSASTSTAYRAPMPIPTTSPCFYCCAPPQSPKWSYKPCDPPRHCTGARRRGRARPPHALGGATNPVSPCPHPHPHPPTMSLSPSALT
jgi:hypothetical protein